MALTRSAQGCPRGRSRRAARSPPRLPLPVLPLPPLPGPLLPCLPRVALQRFLLPGLPLLACPCLLRPPLPFLALPRLPLRLARRPVPLALLLLESRARREGERGALRDPAVDDIDAEHPAGHHVRAVQVEDDGEEGERDQEEAREPAAQQAPEGGTATVLGADHAQAEQQLAKAATEPAAEEDLVEERAPQRRAPEQGHSGPRAQGAPARDGRVRDDPGEGRRHRHDQAQYEVQEDRVAAAPAARRRPDPPAARVHGRLRRRARRLPRHRSQLPLP